jgi:hypothetical protein
MLWNLLVINPLRWIAFGYSRKRVSPGERPRAPQEPYRRCVPPGIHDAVPFSYTEPGADSEEA